MTDGGTLLDWMEVPPVRTGWSTPPSRLDGVPPQDWLGYPPSGLDGGIPSVRRQRSRVSTCYAAGGMPLAFTQEDFLVHMYFYTAFLILSVND